MDEVKDRTKKTESRQKPEHCQKVNQDSNTPKFQAIVKANAQAKLQWCMFVLYGSVKHSFACTEKTLLLLLGTCTV